MGNHLISITDFSADEILQVLRLAREVKGAPRNYQTSLQGKQFGLIFEKPSTRTWISFEAGVFSLGGGAIYLGPEAMKLGVREEARDVARVLDRYLAGLIMRTFAHETITEFKKYFTKPVINGLSDFEHPCQALADYLTLLEKFGSVAKPVLAFVGDGNNVLNSLLLLAATLGGSIHYATPKKYEPNAEVLKRAKKIAAKTGASIEGFHDPSRAIKEADVVYTDVWVSMGEEKMRRQKIRAFKGFQVNGALLKKGRKNPYVMHCLPAHRGEEITNDVMEGKRSLVFDQAENRLHVQKAVLLHLCE